MKPEIKTVDQYFQEYCKVIDSLIVISPEIRSTVKTLLLQFIRNLREKHDLRNSASTRREIWDECREEILNYEKQLRMYSIFSNDFYRILFITPIVHIDHYWGTKQF
jgi:hypothetical protein